MLKRNLALALGTFLSLAATAQTDSATAPLSVTGSVDVYYRYDLSQTDNNKTSFTNSHNRFELGMATVKLEHKTAKFDVVADLGFGKRATEFSYNDNGILAAVKQLYIRYSPAEWLKITAGTWATHIGYEVVDAYANRNYSMSYMFTNGPFFHTGVNAEVRRGSSSFMLGIANPTDYKYVPNGVLNKKALLAQYTFTPNDHFKAYVNYVGGQGTDTSKSNQVDVVLTSKISPKFSIAYNGTINNTRLNNGNGKLKAGKSWWGSAVYLNLDPTEHFGLTLREEYFSDRNRLKVYGTYLEGGSVIATTLSANIKINSLILVPEFRIDDASKKIFSHKNGSGAKAEASALIAAIYVF